MDIDIARLKELLQEVKAEPWMTPLPWATPTETGDYGERQPVDHEGCLEWPWAVGSEMRLAYWLRNNAEEILVALEANQQPSGTLAPQERVQTDAHSPTTPQDVS